MRTGVCLQCNDIPLGVPAFNFTRLVENGTAEFRVPYARHEEATATAHVSTHLTGLISTMAINIRPASSPVVSR
jgi:hypothetical protein